MWKCFLQFTALAISMKFKLEEPPCALSPGAKPHSVETLVLLGLIPRVDGSQGVPTPRVGSKDHPSAVEAQDSEVWY